MSCCAISTNQSNLENCNITIDNNKEDFFTGLFENRPSKTFAVIFSCLGGSIVLSLLYSIIWYERFGSDNKRTLLNKLVSSLCWTCFEWFFSIQIVDMFRYVVGPLPQFLCIVELYLKNAIFTQQMLLIIGIIITRYLFIFWLKNPVAFQDDFWNLFLNIWIIGYSLITQGISFLMPGRYTLYFYICTGKNPLPFEKIPLKSGLHLQILSLVMFLSHIFVSLKTYNYKQKIEPIPNKQIRPLNL